MLLYPPEAATPWDHVGLPYIRTAPIPVVGMARRVPVRGCSHVGLHGTPHRWTVGRAVSHGCVRLYDEHIRRVFDLVDVGTPVVVLP